LSGLRIDNQEIIDIGIIYHGHSKRSYVEVLLENCRIPIKQSELNLFCSIFSDINWEDGEFLHRLKGRYVRIGIDSNSKVRFIKHITKDLTFYCDED
jgi:hypothetical protein